MLAIVDFSVVFFILTVLVDVAGHVGREPFALGDRRLFHVCSKGSGGQGMK